MTEKPMYRKSQTMTFTDEKSCIKEKIERRSSLNMNGGLKLNTRPVGYLASLANKYITNNDIII